MNNYRTSNPESRAVTKFYDRIRLHLDDIDPPAPSEVTSIRDRLKDVKEENAYGLISKQEFEAILKAYNDQSENPTKCDRFEAGNFAKLLYSKPGFHHPAATAYLISELKIKDKNCDSFLGGHSTYTTPENNSLTSLRKRQLVMYIRERTGELLDAMESEDPRTFVDEIDELFKLDQRNGNILAVSGRYNLKMRYFDASIISLRDAMKLGCDHVERVKKYLSEALYQKGVESFRKDNYDQASDIFLESISFDNTNAGSKLHLEMCHEKIAEQRRIFGTSHNTFHSRRK